MSSSTSSGRGYARSVMTAWQSSRVLVWVVLIIVASLAFLTPATWVCLMLTVVFTSIWEFSLTLNYESTPGTKLRFVILGLVAVVGGVLVSTGLRFYRPELLLVILVTVVFTDTGAIVIGRYLRLGRKFIKRPFSRYSPNKTWEGTGGGIFIGVVAGALTTLATGRTVGFLTIAVLLMVSIMGIVGDLSESAWKRSAGIKDSSRLLGPMGGVLDRMDSLSVGLLTGALLLLT